MTSKSTSISRLRRFACAGLIMAGLAGQAWAGAAGDAANQADEQLGAALKAGDGPGVAQWLDEQFFYNPANGKTLSKTQWVGLLAAGTVKVGSLEREQVRVLDYGDTVLITGIEHVDEVIRGKTNKAHSRFTHVWRQQAGRWQLLARQASSLPAAQ